MPPPATRATRVPRAGWAALAAAVAVLAAGCGITTTGPGTAGAPASGVPLPGSEARTVRLYFAGPYGPGVVNRPTDRRLTPQRALDLLLEGPTAAERKRGLTTEVPPMSGQLTANADQGAVDIHIPRNVRDLDVTAVSQIACTAAHADVPGKRPPTGIDIRMYEYAAPAVPWTVRCGSNGAARPAGAG
ncbi:hypothetical protein G5C65_10390 [Streptomyces sp. SB3404]|uniref:Lipoprotein n=1 Tax=Streptomyces boncukensis TaxID=2711219 RepID=A0A6G4WW43_9ACTN|nr:hypothetical protein [Streptomyces boncukensis]